MHHRERVKGFFFSFGSKSDSSTIENQKGIYIIFKGDHFSPVKSRWSLSGAGPAVCPAMGNSYLYLVDRWCWLCTWVWELEQWSEPRIRIYCCDLVRSVLKSNERPLILLVAFKFCWAKGKLEDPHFVVGYNLFPSYEQMISHGRRGGH